LEPDRIIELLSLLDKTDEECVARIGPLRTSLNLIKEEMSIAEESSFEAVKETIENAYNIIIALSENKEEIKNYNLSTLKIVQQSFSDKMICVKDDFYIKLIHRDPSEESFNLDHSTSFGEAPRTLEDKVTLTLLHKFVKPLFSCLNW